MVKQKQVSSIPELKRVQAKTFMKAKTPYDEIRNICKISYKRVYRLKRRRPPRKKGSGRKKILKQSQKTSIRNRLQEQSLPHCPRPDRQAGSGVFSEDCEKISYRCRISISKRQQQGALNA